MNAAHEILTIILIKTYRISFSFDWFSKVALFYWCRDFRISDFENFLRFVNNKKKLYDGIKFFVILCLIGSFASNFPFAKKNINLFPVRILNILIVYSNLTLLLSIYCWNAKQFESMFFVLSFSSTFTHKTIKRLGVWTKKYERKNIGINDDRQLYVLPTQTYIGQKNSPSTWIWCRVSNFCSSTPFICMSGDHFRFLKQTCNQNVTINLISVSLIQNKNVVGIYFCLFFSFARKIVWRSKAQFIVSNAEYHILNMRIDKFLAFFL